MSTPLGLALLITAALNLCCGYKWAAASPDRNVRVGGVPTKKRKILSLSYLRMYVYRTYSQSKRAVEETHNHRLDDIVYLEQQLLNY